MMLLISVPWRVINSRTRLAVATDVHPLRCIGTLSFFQLRYSSSSIQKLISKGQLNRSSETAPKKCVNSFEGSF